MLRIVIWWTYYKENAWFSSWNARQKKECVFFYEYDDYIWYIIQNMEFSELQRLRLKLYQEYQEYIKFTRFTEKSTKWDIFTWYKLQSPIIEVPLNDFACLLDVYTRKRYFEYDNVREKYYLKWDFINYVELNV